MTPKTVPLRHFAPRGVLHLFFAPRKVISEALTPKRVPPFPHRTIRELRPHPRPPPPRRGPLPVPRKHTQGRTAHPPFGELPRKNRAWRGEGCPMAPIRPSNSLRPSPTPLRAGIVAGGPAGVRIGFELPAGAYARTATHRETAISKLGVTHSGGHLHAGGPGLCAGAHRADASPWSSTPACRCTRRPARPAGRRGHRVARSRRISTCEGGACSTRPVSSWRSSRARRM